MRCRLWVVMGLIVFARTAGLFASELPVEHFFRAFEFSNVKLSPGGKYLAAVRRDGDQPRLLIVDLTSFETRVACSGSFLDYDWVSEDRLIVQGGGVQTGGMFAVDRDGKEPQATARGGAGPNHPAIRPVL